MTKKKKIVIVLAILAALCILFIGGKTFSKYMTEVKGVGTASVAKWNFKVNGTEEEIQTINLASTINNETLANNKIAPGTSGNFEIRIDGSNAEVGIDYKIEFLNEKNLPQNLIFKYNGKSYDSIVKLNEVLNGKINANDEQKQKSFVINWEWPYETGVSETEIAKNDKIDTENGKSNLNYTFDVLVTGTQVIPQN